MWKFSPKQKRVLQWWQGNSPDKEKDAIICDGAVRSGKTLCTGLSFFIWAMCSFEGRRFAVCGKTIASVRRNLLMEVLPILRAMGFSVEERVSQNKVTVRIGKRENVFYFFGGSDERSASLIQGITLAGALLDEVALMPRSFVEQCCARCSVSGSRLWFSCNPESPVHWFYREWICNTQGKNALHLTFTMEDNPSLSKGVRGRYESMFEGAFYRRFILGQWVATEGRVYDFFDESFVEPVPQGELEEYYVSCDYGTVNPTSMGLWGRRDGVWYRVREYYFNSKTERRQNTDSEYADALSKLVEHHYVRAVVVDPSAASFIEVLRRRGWLVMRAKNDVISGIRRTAERLKAGKIVICEGCESAIQEFQLYRWEDSSAGDCVRKEHDHAMDEIRYFSSTIVSLEEDRGGCYAGSVARERF